MTAHDDPHVTAAAALARLRAGNVLGPSIAGTLQYAGTHLRTPLFFVLGHEVCGAVDAALPSSLRGAGHRSHVEALLDYILPALDGLDASLSHDALLHAAVEANVRHTVALLRAAPEAREAMQTRGMQLVGAVHELASGRVRFLT